METSSYQQPASLQHAKNNTIQISNFLRRAEIDCAARKMPAAKTEDHAQPTLLQNSLCKQASCQNPVPRFSVSHNNGSGFQRFALNPSIQMQLTLEPVSPAIDLIVVLFLLFCTAFFLRSLYTSLRHLHYVCSHLRFCVLLARCSGVSISFVEYVSALISSS
jgi:hypothetical protein